MPEDTKEITISEIIAGETAMDFVTTPIHSIKIRESNLLL
jgi:hypothetical protein